MRHWKEIPLFKDVTYGEWSDWRWQWHNRIETVEELSEVIPLTEEAKEGVRTALEKVRMAITPYYAGLMDPAGESCPVRLQAVPTASEVEVKPWEFVDPLDEDADSPVEGLVHRYPDRVLFLVTEQCSMYCRHCTRRRVVGVTDKVASTERMEAGIGYIREHKEVRDVLISGGDPLTLSDDRLEWILQRLREIPHVEVLRSDPGCRWCSPRGLTVIWPRCSPSIIRCTSTPISTTRRRSLPRARRRAPFWPTTASLSAIRACSFAG